MISDFLEWEIELYSHIMEERCMRLSANPRMNDRHTNQVTDILRIIRNDLKSEKLRAFTERIYSNIEREMNIIRISRQRSFLI
jgi:hypothetical protein